MKGFLVEKAKMAELEGRVTKAEETAQYRRKNFVYMFFYYIYRI